METIYNVDYFINKFEAIPENKWIVGNLEDAYGNRCALGHCQLHDRKVDANKVTPETSEFVTIGFPVEAYSMVDVNNGVDPRYQQPTPKQRVLACLYEVKAKQQPTLPEVKEVIKYVTVDASVRELQEKVLSEN